MPNTYTCNYTLPSAANGGKLTGPGFGNKPTLAVGDQIQAVVQVTGNGGPTALAGYYVFSPAADATTSQSGPSPFFAGSNYLCLAENAGTADASGKNFTFPVMTYAGGQPGKYELTFVVQDPSSGAQWSEDPEFDTGG